MIDYLSLLISKEIDLLDIPEEFRTHMLCMAAIKQNGANIKYVPENIKTIDFYQCLINLNINNFKYITNPSEEIVEFYNKIVKLFCNFVSKPIYSPEECWAVVNEKYFSLQYVFEHLITYELCLHSIYRDPSMIKFVPKQFLTEELCEKTIKQNAFHLSFVPEHFQIKLQKYALQQDIDNFKYIKNPSQEIIDLHNLLSI
jgi:hypothetical protein